MHKIEKNEARTYYQALLEKDTAYEGIFFVGVKTTGVFCKPTCPARKPKFVNCEFFRTAQEALISSYRPCQRCQPLSSLTPTPTLIRKLVDAVERHPEKKWTEQDFNDLSIDSVAARRHFKKKFGMTFVCYARSRRMGIAFEQIRKGNSIIDSQLNAGYESSSGFRDAFSRIMGAPPSRLAPNHTVLKVAWIDTLLGPMCAISDEKGLYLLEFSDRRGLEREIERLRLKKKAAIIPGQTHPILKIKEELTSYFSGTLKHFKTPVHLIGSEFQRKVWGQLLKIPYGQTKSYLDQAKTIGNTKACRAIANANGANQLALIVPCHRIINENGNLGGYGGGLSRKQWLINHEKKHLVKHNG